MLCVDLATKDSFLELKPLGNISLMIIFLDNSPFLVTTKMVNLRHNLAEFLRTYNISVTAYMSNETVMDLRINSYHL